MAITSVYDPITNTTKTQYTPDATVQTPVAPTNNQHVNPNTGKTNEQVLAESTAVAQTAAATIGQTYTPPTNIPNPVPAPNLQTTGTPAPTLPTPTAPGLNETFTNSLTAEADRNRKAVEDAYKTQLAEIEKNRVAAEKKIQDLTTLQQENVLGNVDTLSQPFRQTLEDTQREKLYVNENFEANQKLTNELDSLLTQGNELITAQKAKGGLDSLAVPRLNQTISDVNARAGVIQAVMSARNGQIGQAYTMIDRSVAAITADRQDRLAYYSTLYNFYEGQKDMKGKKLVTLDNDKKTFLNAQIGLLENDLKRSQETADNIKEAMTNPETALTYAEAGITLNDSPEQINAKLAKYAQVKEVRDSVNEMSKAGFKPVSGAVSAGAETRSFTDSKGITRTYYKPVVLPKTTANGSIDKSSLTSAQLKDFEVNTQRKVSEIESLLLADGLDSRVGPTAPSRRQYAILDAFGAGDYFAGSIQTLLGTLTLDKLISAKGSGATFGALSEGELALLAASASKINTWEIWKKDGKDVPYGTVGATPSGEWKIDEASFKAELQKIIDWSKEDAKRKLGYDPTLVKKSDLDEIDLIFSGISSGEFNPEYFFNSSSTR